jgi:hypothetical protein
VRGTNAGGTVAGLLSRNELLWGVLLRCLPPHRVLLRRYCRAGEVDTSEVLDVRRHTDRTRGTSHRLSPKPFLLRRPRPHTPNVYISRKCSIWAKTGDALIDLCFPFTGTVPQDFSSLVF